MRKFSLISSVLILVVCLLTPAFAQAAGIYGPETFTADRKKWFSKKRYYHRSFDYFQAPKKNYKAILHIAKEPGDKLNKAYLILNYRFIPLKQILKKKDSCELNVKLWKYNLLYLYFEGKNKPSLTIEIKDKNVTPKPVVSFIAMPDTITLGESSQLSWNVTHADTVSINNGIGEVDASGDLAVNPQATTQYELTATGSGGTTTATATVTVNIPPPVVTLSASPDGIKAGESVTLTWTSEHADTCTIAPGIGPVDLSGAMSVTPSSTTTYTITATGPAESKTASAAVTVFQPPAASITVSPSDILKGESATLSWNAVHADTCTIDPGIGTVPVSGSMTVSPGDTRTYTLTAQGPGGQDTASAVITVTDPDLPPEVAFDTPEITIQEGESADLTWTSSHAANAVIDNGIGAVPVNGSVTVSPAHTTLYTITVSGITGTAGDQVRVKVTGAPVPPPEGSFGDHYKDLIPTDATKDSYDAKRFSIITGLVHDNTGAPLPSVDVTIKGMPEYGTATTDDQGRFAVPVEGGGFMTFVYTKKDHIPVHRTLNVPWNDTAIVDTIRMLSEDPVATTITFDGDPNTIITHKSSETTDASGTRACSMVFSGDNKAWVVDENGNDVQALTTITTRATEFSTPESMPSILPPASAFTYCSELSVDGVQRVRFEKPLSIWVDNFLGFDVGEIVPVGYFDRDKGVWVPSDNGVVVELLDQDSDGIVDALDADGDGQPDDLNSNGLFSDETAGLDDNTSYPPGATFWRSEISHFTPVDCNWPAGLEGNPLRPNPFKEPSGGDDDTPPVCLIKGTLVRTQGGMTPIEIIRKGDLVFSRDETSGAASLRRVTNTYKTPNRKPVRIIFTNENNEAETIGATREHPFWKEHTGWTPAGNLRPGDRVATFDNQWLEVSSIDGSLPGQTVYNIEVEGFHTYFAGSQGLWVHNACFDTIHPKERTLDYDITLPGTGMTLHYSSKRVEGYKTVISVPASGETVSDILTGIRVRLNVAGHAMEKNIDPLPNQTVDFEWDGFDFMGNPVNRPVSAHVQIGFVYDRVYTTANTSAAQAFGQPGENLTNVLVREDYIVWKESSLTIIPAAGMTAGNPGRIAKGWTLSSHHYTGPDSPVLLKGDGTTTENYGDIITEWFRPDRVGPIVMDPAGNIYMSPPYNDEIQKINQDQTWVDIGDTATWAVGGGINSFNSTEGICMDSAGNLYIADSGYHRVFKLDTSGVITCVAGNGEDGFSGDNGPATEAKLNTPRDVAVDADGNLYIADTYNSRIRKVDTAGTITTIAGSGLFNDDKGDGGPAAEAVLGHVGHIATDYSGNLYLTDGFSIRKIDTGGIITTVAGTWDEEGYNGDDIPATTALLNWPGDIAVDPDGNLFIADSDNNRIRKVDTYGIITTVAGNGEAGYEGNGEPAVKANLNHPTDVILDPDGNIYLTDFDNGVIRMIEYYTSNAASDDEMFFPEDIGLGYILSDIGRHKRTIDLDTRVTLLEFGYDGDNRLNAINDRFGAQTTIERDSLSVPLAVVSPDGVRTELVINGDGHLKEVIYEDGSTYQLSYTAGGLLTLAIEPEGNQYEYEFDGQGRLTDSQDEEGGHETYTKELLDGGDTEYTVSTAEGSQTMFLDHPNSDGSTESTITAPSGEQIIFLIEDMYTYKTTPCEEEVSYYYANDPEYKFKVLKEKNEYSPSIGMTTLNEKTYEDTDSDGIPDLITETVTLDSDKTFTYEHDVLSSTRTTSTPEGRTNTLHYDPATLLTQRMVRPGLHDILYTYDARGRLTTLESSARTSRFTYNDKGFLAGIIDAENQTTGFAYDAVGRVTRIDRPDSTSLWYEYDKNGNMTVLTNPSSTGHGFDYNKVNLNTGYTPPLSTPFQYVYDKDRRLTSEVFPSGKSLDYIYNSGRLSQVQTPQGNIDYSYACGDNPASVSSGSETISYEYSGRLLEKEILTGTLDQSITYKYNDDRSLQSMNFGWGAIGYDYDNDGLLIESGNYTISRDAQNGLPETVSDWNFNIGRVFNGHAEIASLSQSVDGYNILSWSLDRDDNGRITQKTETIAGITTVIGYTYDAMGRLLTVTVDGDLAEEYQYNTNGARVLETNVPRDITDRALAYSEEDHLVTAGEFTYQYDFDSFLMSKTDGTDTTEYTYSIRGELLDVSLPDGRTIEYLHDPLGRRIAKKVDGVITEKYLWQGRTRLLGVFDGSGGEIALFDYADGRMPVAMYDKNGDYYYLAYDQVGSLRAVADGNGNVVKQITYDTFGNIFIDTNPGFEVPFGFAGGLHDTDTGLVRFGYRDYDPEIGRWTSKDPILFAGGDSDLFGYCLNDPVNMIDPLGLRNYGGKDGWKNYSNDLRATGYPPVKELTPEQKKKLFEMLDKQLGNISNFFPGPNTTFLTPLDVMKKLRDDFFGPKDAEASEPNPGTGQDPDPNPCP